MNAYLDLKFSLFLDFPIAVEMRIAEHPPHRSERLQFRDSAPTLGPFPGGLRPVRLAAG
jgi:hypothetical protein